MTSDSDSALQAPCDHGYYGCYNTKTGLLEAYINTPSTKAQLGIPPNVAFRFINPMVQYSLLNELGAAGVGLSP